MVIADEDMEETSATTEDGLEDKGTEVGSDPKTYPQTSSMHTQPLGPTADQSRTTSPPQVVL